MKEDNNKIFTGEEIRRYLDQKMTTAQMHELEKAAMDDPFLAEAIEGYQFDGKNMSRPALKMLEEELNKKVTGHQAKVIPLHPAKNNGWKKAIVAVFILGILSIAGYFTFFRSTNESSLTVPLARNDNPQQTQPDSIVATVPTDTEPVKATTPGDRESGQDEVVSRIQPTGETESPYQPGNTGKIEVAKDIKVPVTEENDVSKKTGTTEATPDETNSAGKEVPATKLAESTISESTGIVYKTSLKEKKEATEADYDIAALNKMFIAQVVGSDNMPLPFANINVRSDKFGTYADAKGNFRLISSDSLLEVEVKSVGYQTQNIMLRSEPGLKKIVLEEDKMAVQNVAGKVGSIITNRQQLRGRFVKDSAENVEPADGWASYEAYVDNNIQVPEIVIDRDIKGTVDISFDVRKNGSISNAKIDKSLCEDCDEEALRLIKQGPQWKVKKGRKGKSKVKVRF